MALKGLFRLYLSLRKSITQSESPQDVNRWFKYHILSIFTMQTQPPSRFRTLTIEFGSLPHKKTKKDERSNTLDSQDF